MGKNKVKKVLLVDHHGFDWKESKLKRIGNTYVEPLTGKTFPMNTKPIMFNGKLTYLFDAMKGVALEPEIDGNVLKLKTNPELISTMIEPEILQRAFKFRPALKMIIAAFIIGVAAGALFFAPVI